MGILRLKGIYKSYATKHNKNAFSLSNINITFQDKGLSFIKGKSGSGKSTILNLISLLERPDKGKILFNNVDITSLKGKDKQRYLKEDIAIIFQHYNLFDELSSLDNVLISSSICGISEKEAKKSADKLFKRFGIEYLKNKKTKLLSGGEKQRVAIIRALIRNPKMILCDEPTGALDSINSKITMDILKEISNDILVIIVSHNEELINEYADEIFFIKDGRLIDKEIINKIDDKKTYKKERLKRSKNNYVNKFISIHLKQNLSKNIMMIISSVIGLAFLLLSIGFDNGSKQSIINHQNKSLSAFSYVVQNKEYEEIEGSLLSLVKLTRPNENDLLFIKDEIKEYEIDYNLSFFFPNYLSLYFDDTYIDEVMCVPIIDKALLSVDKSMLIDGELSFNNSLNNIIVNKEFIDKYDFKNKDIKLSYKTSIDYPVIDVERSYVKDSFECNIDTSISGVIKEFSFMNQPKIYYSYFHVKEYLSHYLLSNISDYKSSNYYALDLIKESNDSSIFSSYSYNLFLLDDEVSKAFSLISKLKEKESTLSIENTAYELLSAYESLVSSFITSMYLFVIISIVGVIFILGITTYSSFVHYKKERAILSSMGAGNNSILDIFLNESILISLLSAVLSILLSFPLSKLVSKLFFTKFNVDNLIIIPFAKYFNIAYFPIIAVTLLAIIISFLSCYIPYLSFKRKDLKEDLKDE